MVYDLAERVTVAERQSNREVVLFGTPDAQPYQAEGFFRWAGGKGDRFVWARREVEVALSLPNLAPRAAVVDWQAFQGVRDQRAIVKLNGARVAEVAVGETRQRALIPLPAASQKTGQNRLRFEFAATSSTSAVDPRSSDGGQLAAAFFSLVVGAAEDDTLAELLGRDAPRAFAQAEVDKTPALTQLGTSSVRYAITLPRGAELRFTPDLLAAARARDGILQMRVTLEARAGQEREIWRRGFATRDAGSIGEVTLKLDGQPGDAVRLGLHVSGDPSDRFAWAVWKAPRVMGEVDTSTKADEGRLAGLRSTLAGKNVVFVILDAARAAQVGAYGYPKATTPNLDRIAKEGIVFERAYTPAVYTVGAMSSVWTSQAPDQHHGETSFEARLPKDRLTLGEVLSGRGVHTAGFVANAMAGKALGFDRGFAEFHEVFGDPELGSRAELFRRRLPEWLRKNRARRFFLYVHFREPHFPYDPPSEFRTRFGPDAPLSGVASRDRAWYVDVNQRRTRPTSEEIAHLTRLYDGKLAYVDQELGALRKELETAGLWDDLTLIVAADHGEQLWEHGYISHSAQVYEESAHVPLVVKLPKQAGVAPRRVTGLVELGDLAPTIADLFGTLGQGGSDREFDGRTLLPLLTGGAGRAEVVSRSVWERPLYALRGERFKLIRDTRSGDEELYGLEGDPKEKQNLAKQQPIRAAALRQDLFAWMARVRERRAGAGEKSSLTKEQCENMRSLGYLGACP